MTDLFLMILLSTAIFGRSLFGEFLFDDPTISDQAQAGAFLRPSFRNLTQFHHAARPVTDSVQRFVWTYFRLTPWAWHSVNLIVHAACVILAYVVFVPILGTERAILAASIVAIHPLQASCACYISGLAPMLATLFTLCGLAHFQMGGIWHLSAAAASQYFAWKSKPDAILYAVFYPMVWLLSGTT